MKNLKLSLLSAVLVFFVSACTVDSSDEVIPTNKNSEVEKIQVKNEENGDEPNMPPKMP